MVFQTWPMDQRRIGVRCSACDSHGSIMVSTDGDINVDVDLGILDAWCSEHVPPRLRSKHRKGRAHVCNDTCLRADAAPTVAGTGRGECSGCGAIIRYGSRAELEHESEPKGDAHASQR